MKEPDYSILAKLRPPTSKNNHKKSYVGQKFNRLTVFSLMGYTKDDNARSYWLCRCDCGNFSIVALYKLKNGTTKSCGCYRLQVLTTGSTTHGMNRTPAHRRWTDMYNRCTNPKFKSYADYGGRGISVCQGFRKFEVFYDLLGEPPKDYQLNRVNNELNYSCGSCQECLSKNWPMNVEWASRKSQARNKRTTRWITIKGETKSMAEWVEISGVKQPVAWKRLNRGMTPEKAFDMED